MKRCGVSREELAVHEAGHLVAIAISPHLAAGDFVWRRLPQYEIAHIEPVTSNRLDWETPSDRNTIIAQRAVAALGGGAAATIVARPDRWLEQLGIDTVHETVGKVDFELAHEWLTLQRYDPDQRSIESDITRLFRELCGILDTSPHRNAISTIRRRILEHLRTADTTGADEVELPVQLLLDGLVLKRRAEFALKATVARHSAAG